jgi:hypothetical protein
MKRLEIPNEEKDKGMIWVEYELLEVDTVVELKIQQEKN